MEIKHSTGNSEPPSRPKKKWPPYSNGASSIYEVMHLAPGLGDWTELLEALDAYGIRCLIVDGVAAAFHGEPRFTKDIDLLVSMDSHNADCP